MALAVAGRGLCVGTRSTDIKEASLRRRSKDPPPWERHGCVALAMAGRGLWNHQINGYQGGVSEEAVQRPTPLGAASLCGICYRLNLLIGTLAFAFALLLCLLPWLPLTQSWSLFTQWTGF